MDEKEIVHSALQIEKSNADRSYDNILTLLGDLDKSHVTAEQLETTDIGKVLFRLLKTCHDSGVKYAVRCLLSKWKRQCSRDSQCVKCMEVSKDPELSCWVALQNGGATEEGVSKQEDSHSGPVQTCDGAVENVKAPVEEEAASLMAKEDLQTSTADSSDCSSVRAKCVQLLVNAISPEAPDQGKAAEMAADVEQHIWKLHTSSQVKYKACVRSKVANLRNPKSGHLRLGLLSGALSPEAFAQMSAAEMASTELRQLREQYSSQGMSERQLPQVMEGMETHKIKCKRCSGSDCRVTQVSRGTLFLPAWVRPGGDDDALTFVTCSSCGQQWYHSSWVCL